MMVAVTLSERQFLDAAREAFPTLVLIRWSRAGGGKDYIWVESFDDFRIIYLACPAETNLIIFEKCPRPLSETPEKLIVQAKDLIQDNVAWLVVNLGDCYPRHLDSDCSLGIPNNFEGDYYCELLEIAEHWTSNGTWLLFPKIPILDQDPSIETYVGGKPGAY